MPRFPNTEYKYFDENGNPLGTHDGFLNGLSLYPDSAYVEKHIDGQLKEKIDVCQQLNTCQR